MAEAVARERVVEEENGPYNGTGLLVHDSFGGVQTTRRLAMGWKMSPGSYYLEGSLPQDLCG